MMGLFGKNFNTTDAVLGLFGVPVEGRKNRRLKRQEMELEADEKSAVYVWAKEQGYSDAEARALANDPKAASAITQARDKPVEFATTGGSRFDPRTGAWIRAPGRDADGNEYGLSTDPTQAQPVTRRGNKTVPFTAGGGVQVLDALSGLSVAEDGSVIGLPDSEQTAPGYRSQNPMLGPPQQQPMGQGGNLSGWTPGMFGSDPVRNAPRLPDPMGFGGMTSGRRTVEGNRAVNGVRNSDHLRGEAADFTPRPGETLAQARERARQYFGPNARPEIHNNNHVHVGGLRDVPYYGKNGTRGLNQRGPIRVRTKAQRDALPPGTQYIAPDGRVMRKR